MWRRYVLWLAIAALLPGPAQACKCLPLSPADHIEQSDFIFRGEVIDKRSDAGLLNPLSRGERVVFDVTRTWKGPQLKKMIIHVTSTSSAACGMDFALGWTGVIFARADENGEPSTNLCQMMSYDSRADSGTDYDVLLPGHRGAR